MREQEKKVQLERENKVQKIMEEVKVSNAQSIQLKAVRKREEVRLE